MGESEARTITYGWEANPKQAPNPNQTLDPNQPPDPKAAAAHNRRAWESVKKHSAEVRPATRKEFIRSLDGKTEREYCQAMHDAGLETPTTWQKWRPKGCPADYLDAFQLKNKTLRNDFLEAVRHNERRNSRRK